MFGCVPFVIGLMYLLPSKNRAIRRGVSKAFILLTGLSIRYEGIIDPEAQIIMLNHQSYLDVIALEAVHPNNLCWIAKKQLGEPFLYGHALKAPRMILLDREDKKGLVFLLKIAKERLDEERVLAIFPEGTRSKGDGNLLPFKGGAKMIAQKYDLLIQPFALTKTRSIFDLAKLTLGGDQARVIALPSFRPSQRDEHWLEEMRESIQRHIAQIQS